MMEEQLGLFKGIKLRDEAIQHVTEHNEEWFTNACLESRRFILDQENPFTGEDIRVHCQNTIGHPTHHNAWGALINWLVKHELVVPTGRYRQMKDPTSHARRTPLYIGSHAREKTATQRKA